MQKISGVQLAAGGLAGALALAVLAGIYFVQAAGGFTALRPAKRLEPAALVQAASPVSLPARAAAAGAGPTAPAWIASGMLGYGLLTGPFMLQFASRYPGSELYGDQDLPAFSEDGRSLSRESSFLSSDPLAPVRAWYAKQYEIPPSADNVPAGGSECAYFSQSKIDGGLTFSASVLACSVPHGTAITVNQVVSILQ